jgi:hypothetical protein
MFERLKLKKFGVFSKKILAFLMDSDKVSLEYAR